MAKKKKIASEADIFSKYAHAGYANVIAMDGDKTPWIPSRVIGLNAQLGGGMKYGTIAEGYGLESSGKSYLGSEFAVVTQSLGGVVIWVDGELCFDPKWQRAIGLNPEDVMLYQGIDIYKIANFIKDSVMYWRSKLTHNEPIFVVLDSIAALDVDDDDEDEEISAGGQMGNVPKALYKFFKKVNPVIFRAGAVMYCINQIRMKIGAKPWEMAETTPGGKALGFYASQRIMFQKSKAIKLGGKASGLPLGREIIISQHKSKVSPPSNSYRANMYFREGDGHEIGFDRYAGFYEALKERGVVKTKGAYIYYKGKSLANGEAKFMELIRDDKSLRSKLISKLGVNTVSKTRELIESSENLYKV